MPLMMTNGLISQLCTLMCIMYCVPDLGKVLKLPNYHGACATKQSILGSILGAHGRRKTHIFPIDNLSKREKSEIFMILKLIFQGLPKSNCGVPWPNFYCLSVFLYVHYIKSPISSQILLIDNQTNKRAIFGMCVHTQSCLVCTASISDVYGEEKNDFFWGGGPPVRAQHYLL